MRPSSAWREGREIWPFTSVLCLAWPAEPAGAAGAGRTLAAGGGAVAALEGAGDDARAQVKFNRHGIKWLALSVAKLTPVT